MPRCSMVQKHVGLQLPSQRGRRSRPRGCPCLQVWHDRWLLLAWGPGQGVRLLLLLLPTGGAMAGEGMWMTALDTHKSRNGPKIFFISGSGLVGARGAGWGFVAQVADGLGR
jgi:hypothetical protein